MTKTTGMDPFHFLQEALFQSLRARQTFDDFLDSESDRTPDPSLQKSFDSTKACLQMLERLPFQAKYPGQTQRAIEQLKYDWKRLQMKDLRSTKDLERLPFRMLKLRQYDRLLRKLQKLLNQFVHNQAKNQSDQQHWQELRSIHPRSPLLHAMRPLLKPLANQRNRRLLMGGSFLLVFISASIYFFTPYQAETFVILNPVYSASTLKGHPKPVSLAQASSQISADGTEQTITHTLEEPREVSHLALGVELRSERKLQLQRIDFFDVAGNLLNRVDFQDPQREQWSLINTTYAGGYLLHGKGFQTLQTLYEDPKHLLEQAILFELENPETLKLSQALLESLNQLSGKHFSSKKALHNALDQLDVSPTWQQRKLIRNAFKQAIYRRKQQSSDVILLSPRWNAISSVSSIQIVAKIDFPTL